MLRVPWLRRSDEDAIIQSLWIGPRLSAMERLTIRSFLAHGHPFHLYVYEPPEGVPEGTVLESAASILPESSIFVYREVNSYAGFANFFRYKLLLEKGGWYVDMDTVCLQRFDFAAPYVFSSEYSDPVPVLINATMMKVPRGSQAMTQAWDACSRMNPDTLRWGDSGSKLLSRVVEECSLQGYVQPPSVFCPTRYLDWASVLDPEADWGSLSGAYGLHLWHEMWRRSGQDKDASYPAGCLYEKLKARFLS